MALRDQPYLPLYVQDFLTDENLAECSAESTGVYIRLMCIMHKSKEYGTILLKQKDKQTGSKVSDFALKLTRLLPYDVETIERALTELLEENVLSLDGDMLFQKRMVRDGKLSDSRALAGKKGVKKKRENASAKEFAGDFANGFANGFAKAKSPANSENENEIENEIEIEYETEDETDYSRGVVGGNCASPVIVLPLNTGDGYPVTAEQYQEWAGLYPAVDVIQQLRNMKGWLDSNPSKRKTARGILRFINGWLSREQDRGNRGTDARSRSGTDSMSDLRKLHELFDEG